VEKGREINNNNNEPVIRSTSSPQNYIRYINLCNKRGKKKRKWEGGIKEISTDFHNVGRYESRFDLSRLDWL